ncbi:MAG: hypothetical protein JO212_11485, partial [Acetobacteraceae bacterium]|nr:hypothetical protein [Acetobacteraceae bacterium]
MRRMTRDPIDKLFRPRRELTYRGKGGVYSWLRARHAEVAVLMAQGEATWAALAARLAGSGVLGRGGSPPTANAMIRVWKRVCRDAEAEKAAGAAATIRKHPSRMSPNWRPQVAPPVIAAQPVAQSTLPAPGDTASAERPPAKPAAQPSTPEEVMESA